MQDTNLSQYEFDGTFEWYKEACAHFGEETTYAMATTLEEMVKGLQVGESINLVNLCKNKDKIKSVIKIATYICYNSNLHDGPCYEMTNDLHAIRRIY